MIIIHNRNSKESRDFLNNVPTGTVIVDYFCPRTNNGQGNYKPVQGMVSPKNYKDLPVRTFPSQAINVPAYYDATNKQNVDEHQEVKEFETYQEAHDYEVLMQSKSDDSPPLPDDQIPARTPVVLEPLEQAAKMMTDAFNEVLNDDD